MNERIEGANAARYAIVDGEVLSEKRGANRYRFVPDPLGSVRAYLDTSGSIVATRDYWPYGEVAAQSGSMTAIQYVGVLGYFTDTTNRVYVRARHYRPDLGRWVTEDSPLVMLTRHKPRPASAIGWSLLGQDRHPDRDCDIERVRCFKDAAGEVTRCLVEPVGWFSIGVNTAACIGGCALTGAAFPACFALCGLGSVGIGWYLYRICEDLGAELRSSCLCAYSWCTCNRPSQDCFRRR